MHVILTHEQADFDALASLLGAHLLYDQAIPVLPRRINRNGRAFLALYGMEFPFVDPRDLPDEAIETVFLVDTQSMVSLRGMHAKTRVHVIDHHPRKEVLPDDWAVTTVELGATTTLLVEALQERNGLLSPIQATLLLLGIYEDTGSLTYTRTQARDLRAAAFLLEQGASLEIALNFLNHPLSEAQQEIYAQLRQNAKSYHIHGHTVIVACGEAVEMEEEISSIAHKLRDLLDPDALFLLVNTRGGVQLVARSSVEQIDVAEIAAVFGGGGHERAAAGLIRGRSLETLCHELVEALPQFVRPGLTVAEIMSRDPRVLHAEMPVAEAAQWMQRYGYEGFPVVREGMVVGLLTRRAVDRALSHKLNLTVGSLMDSGAYHVHPQDSIERLKRVVTESGWGQIPVLDEENKNVIGIVTRTDLLKTLTPAPQLPGRINLAARLEKALPEDRLRLLKTVAEMARQQGAALFIVGGFVRDLLLERPSLDFDLVVEGDAIALAQALARKYGGRVTSHARFGTAKWHLRLGNPPSALRAKGLETVDLVSARTEFYTHPSALPTVERGSIKLDLHRRDFTINTLALRLDGAHYGELHDYWGGYEDLRTGLVRVLHSLSFVDDPTRILRAIRFEQRFDFQVEERTMQLMMEARNLIERLSGDRIRHELDHILEDEAASKIMRRLFQLGLLRHIHPELTWNERIEARFTRLYTSDPEEIWELDTARKNVPLPRSLGYVLWLIELTPQVALSVCHRLKLSALMQRVVVDACRLWQSLPSLESSPISAWVSALEETPAMARYAVYLALPEGEARQKLWEYAAKWRHVQPIMDGESLKAMGLPPGPSYRAILKALRDAWLDGKIRTPEEERLWIEKKLQEV